MVGDLEGKSLGNIRAGEGGNRGLQQRQDHVLVGLPRALLRLQELRRIGGKVIARDLQHGLIVVAIELDGALIAGMLILLA